MPKHSRTVAIITALLTLPWLAQAQTPIPSAPDLSARGYILVDHDSGKLLAAKNENERLDPASITS